MTIKPFISRCHYDKTEIHIAVVDGNCVGKWFVGNNVSLDDAKVLKQQLDSAIEAIERDQETTKEQE